MPSPARRCAEPAGLAGGWRAGHGAGAPRDAPRVAKGRLLRSWSAAAERGHGEGAPRIRLGSHGEMQRAMHAGGILLPAAGKAHRHAGGALCEMLPVTAPHAASAVTLCWDQLGDASSSPKKKTHRKGKMLM